MPTLIRWPGVIKPGTMYNQFFSHEDFIPTFAAAAVTYGIGHLVGVSIGG